MESNSSRPAIRERSPGGSPLRLLPSDSGLEGLSLHFTESGGCSRKETEQLCPALADLTDEYGVVVAPEYLPTPPAPQVHETSDSCHTTGPSRLDKIYAPHFERLDRELYALKARQQNVPLPKVHIHEGTVPALEAGKGIQFHVPPSVTEGNVPVLGVVGVNAKGGLAFGSKLVEQKAGLTK